MGFGLAYCTSLILKHCKSIYKNSKISFFLVLVYFVSAQDCRQTSHLPLSYIASRSELKWMLNSPLSLHKNSHSVNVTLIGFSV